MTTTELVPPSELTKTKREGLAIIPPLRLEVEQLGAINTEEEYHAADLLLTRIRTAKQHWLTGPAVPVPKSRWRGINAIIQPIYEGLQGLYDLRKEVTDPLDAMEAGVKDSMRTFKRAEKLRIDAQNEARRIEQARIDRELREKTERLERAKTQPLRERLIDQQIDLQQQAKDLKREKPVIVKAHGSAARVTKKPVVQNFREFAMGVLALSEGEGGVPLELLQVGPALMALWKEQPELVASLPGIVIEEDIVIAGRG